jgi:hypothetical protein
VWNSTRHSLADYRVALDNLPALDGDGRWEKLRASLDTGRAELHRNYPFTIEEGVLDRIIDEMDRLTSGDAAKGD